jgi:hypothetical protein
LPAYYQESLPTPILLVTTGKPKNYDQSLAPGWEKTTGCSKLLKK